jgi:hypothetical protein
VTVLYEAGHRGAVNGHVAVAGEMTSHGAAQGGVVWKEAGVVHSPYEFLTVCELGVSY